MKNSIIKYGKSSCFFATVWVLVTWCVFASEDYSQRERTQERYRIIATREAKRKFVQEDLGNHPANFIRLIRDVTGSKVNRNGKVRDVSTLPGSILLGLPEATLLIVTDAYYFAKKSGGRSDKDIFRGILAARMYDRRTIEGLMNKNPRGLKDFVTQVLEIEDQAGYCQHG